MHPRGLASPRASPIASGGPKWGSPAARPMTGRPLSFIDRARSVRAIVLDSRRLATRGFSPWFTSARTIARRRRGLASLRRDPASEGGRAEPAREAAPREAEARESIVSETPPAKAAKNAEGCGEEAGARAGGRRRENPGTPKPIVIDR